MIDLKVFALLVFVFFMIVCLCLYDRKIARQARLKDFGEWQESFPDYNKKIRKPNSGNDNDINGEL